MNNEQQKAKELAKLLTAFADGKQLQYESHNDYWVNYAKHVTVETIYTQANITRIKPETKRIALTQQDLIDRELSGETISLIYSGVVYRIASYDQDGVYFAGGNMFSYGYIKENDYGFLDNSPCYKEVECE